MVVRSHVLTRFKQLKLRSAGADVAGTTVRSDVNFIVSANSALYSNGRLEKDNIASPTDRKIEMSTLLLVAFRHIESINSSLVKLAGSMSLNIRQQSLHFCWSSSWDMLVLMSKYSAFAYADISSFFKIRCSRLVVISSIVCKTFHTFN